MRLVPVDRKEIERPAYHKTDNLLLLEEFIRSGHPACLIEGYTQKDNFIAAGSFRGSIKRFNLHGVDCISRNGKVYLIRTDMEGK